MNAVQPLKNLYFINAAKTIGIFLMALAHLSIPRDLYSFISYRMPLFFILSGYLFSVKEIGISQFINKKIRALIIPYYIFASITFLFWFFIGRNFGEKALIEADVKNYIIGVFFSIPSKEFMGFNLPIWFLPSLFCAEIIYYFIYHFCKKIRFLICIILFSFGIYFHATQSFRLPFGLDVSFFSILFIYIGHKLKEKDILNKYVVHSSIFKKFIIILLAFTGVLLISQHNGAIWMYLGRLNNYWLFFIGVFSEVILVLYLSTLVPRMNIIDFLGRNTIIILGFHLMIFSIIKGIQVFVFNLPLDLANEYWAINILYVLIAFIFLIPVIYLVNRYFPFLLGRKKGYYKLF